MRIFRFFFILLVTAAAQLGVAFSAFAAPTLIVPPEFSSFENVSRIYKSAKYKVEVRKAGDANYTSSTVFETRNDWTLHDFFNSGATRTSSETGQGKSDVVTASFSQFSFADTAVDVRITLLGSAVVNNVTIRPLRFGVKPTISSDKKSITFSVSNPRKISIEFNDRKNPLFIFADAPDVADTGATHYYAPGVHRIPGNGTLVLRSNQRVYISAGAIVEGRFVLANGSTNIKIRGRGILSGGPWPLDVALTGNKKLSYSTQRPYAAIWSDTTSSFELEGITLVQSTTWQVAIEDYSGTGSATRNNSYRNVKTVSFNGCTDAFWITGVNNVIDDVFVFNNDDAFVTKGGTNTKISNAVVWGGVWGRLFLMMGILEKAPSVDNVTLENIDVIGKEGSNTMIVIEGAAAFKKTYSNVTFRNINFEERAAVGNTNLTPYNRFSLVTIDTKLGEGNASLVSDFLFENINLYQQMTSEGFLHGAENQLIKNIKFRNLKANGKVITSLAESKIASNSFVENLTFELPPTPITKPVVSSIPNRTATVGSQFNYNVIAANSPTSFAASGLPVGLTINNSGLISGTPTTTGNSPISVTATNGAGTSTPVTFAIAVNAAPKPVLSEIPNLNANAGAVFSYQTSATNNPTDYTAIGLPTGLTINDNGLISGTTSVIGSFDITVTASNSGGPSTPDQFTLTVSAPPIPVVSAIPALSAVVGATFSYQVSATNGPTSFTATGLPTNLTISTTGTISGIPSVVGNFTVTITATNAIGTSLSKTFVLSVAAPVLKPVVNSIGDRSGTAGSPVSVQVTATNNPTSFAASGLPSGLLISNAGLISGTTSNTGAFTVSVTAQNSAGISDAATFTFTLAAPVLRPIVNTISDRNAATNAIFSYQVTAINAPTSFTATGLPTGLTISSGGLISGTPTLAGTYTVGVTATNSAGSSTVISFTLTVATTPVVTAITARSGIVGTAFSLSVSASNTPTSFAATGLPDGLSINAIGSISGTPAAGTARSYTVGVTASNSAGTSPIVSFTLTISNPVVSPVVAAIPNQSGTAGSVFNYQVSASNTPTSFTATGLPTGISISNAGLISGTTSSTGANSVSVTASNNAGTSSSVTFTLTIGAQVVKPVMNAIADQNAVAGVAVSIQASAINNPAGYSATGLPSGISISSSGLISGSSSVAGVYNVVVSANNSAGTSVVGEPFALSLYARPVVNPIANQSLTATVAMTNLPITTSTSPGTAPSSFSASGLPSNLSISNTGVISGTPTTSGSYVVGVSASNLAGTSAVVNFTITVVAPVRIPAMSAIPNLSATAGAKFSYLATASNAPASFAATGLPGGLSINNSGEISGTISTAGTYNVSVTASNSAGTSPAELFVLTVVDSIPAPVINNIANQSGVTSTQFDYTVIATNSPKSFRATGLPTGITITNGGLITGKTNDTGSFNINVIATNDTGDSLPKEFVLFIAAKVEKPVINAIPDQSDKANTPFSYQVSAINAPNSYTLIGAPSGFSIDNNGLIQGSTNQTGTFTLTITASNSAGTSEPMMFKLTVTAQTAKPVVTVGNQSATADLPFSYQVSASNSPTNFNASGLPTGISINSSGLISGTTNSTGDFPVNVTASNIAGPSASARFILTVGAGEPVKPTITLANTQTGTVGNPLSFSITAINRPTSYDASGMPSWLSFNKADGVFQGTPPREGTSTIKVTATNAHGSDSKDVQIIIAVASSLPKGWKSPQIATNAVVESATESNGVWNLRGRSGTTEGSTDSVIGTWKEVTGDFTFSARLAGIDGISNLSPESFSGVMLRGSVETNAQQASVILTERSGRGISFMRRTTVGGVTAITAGNVKDMSLASIQANANTSNKGVWVRLVRQGELVQGFSSADGTTWNAIRKDRFIALPATLQIGLIASTEGSLETISASYSDVRLQDINGVNLPISSSGTVAPVNITNLPTVQSTLAK